MKLERKNGLKHYKEHKNSCLRKEELDVLLDVLFDVLGATVPTRGSFLLCGQTDNGDMEKIVEFDFRDGKQKHYIGGVDDSDKCAHKNLYAASGYSKKPGYAITHLYNSPLIMSLETSYGRFLAAFFAGSYSEQEIAYHTIVKTLSLIGSKDELLRRSCGRTFEKSSESNKSLLGLESYIEDLFASGSIASLRTLKALSSGRSFFT